VFFGPRTISTRRGRATDCARAFRCAGGALLIFTIAASNWLQTHFASEEELGKVRVGGGGL
jgi:hypothetical protein